MLLGVMLFLPRGHTSLATTLRVLRSQTASKSATRQAWLFTRFLPDWGLVSSSFLGRCVTQYTFQGVQKSKNILFTPGKNSYLC